MAGCTVLLEEAAAIGECSCSETMRPPDSGFNVRIRISIRNLYFDYTMCDKTADKVVAVCHIFSGNSTPENFY